MQENHQLGFSSAAHHRTLCLQAGLSRPSNLSCKNCQWWFCVGKLIHLYKSLQLCSSAGRKLADPPEQTDALAAVRAIVSSVTFIFSGCVRKPGTNPVGFFRLLYHKETITNYFIFLSNNDRMCSFLIFICNLMCCLFLKKRIKVPQFFFKDFFFFSFFFFSKISSVSWWYQALAAQLSVDSWK